MTEWLSSIGPALGNHLWQSTALAALVWLTTLLLRSNQARIRYGLWLAASVKFLLPFSLLVGLGSLLPRPRHIVVAAPVYTAMDKATQPFVDFGMAVSATTVHPSATQRFEHALPALLAAAWLCGVVVVLTVWGAHWRQMSKLRRRAVRVDSGRESGILHRFEEEMGAGRKIALLISQESIEPGMFGIFRPVLIWPERLSERLDDEHIEAILAHEFMHARRRDNLTAALHMLVEAVFWFHPGVWWLEKRMVEERELACDEAVVEAGSRPGIYAESLLRACRFCVESPLLCVSGITGANLNKRIRSIMTLRFKRLSLARKAALGALGFMAIGVPITLGQVKGARVIAAVKASTHAGRDAMSFAARMWSPIEPESSTPSNDLIVSTPLREFQTKEPVMLAQVDAASTQTSKQSPTNADFSRATVQQYLGFEDQTGPALAGWFANPQDTVSADDRVMHAGHWSARLHRDNQSKRTFSVITRSLPLDFQGHVVELSGYLRLQDVSEYAGLWLGEDNDGTMIELENMESQQVKGTRDWVQYRIRLPINSRAKSLDFGVLISGTGTLWADDLELLVDGKPVAEAPSKPTLTNADVIAMSRSAVPESSIILAIESAPLKFDVSAEGILALHAAGVTEPVLDEMLRASSPQKSGNFGVATYSFPVKDAAGKTVRLSAWIKTENVQNGYAGIWWRVDGPGEGHTVLAFDNSAARFINGEPDGRNGTIRGATGTTPWTLYEFELPVDKTASHINFGVLFSGTGTAWFDAMKVELDGEPYSNPRFDFDFESPTVKGFYAGCGGNAGCTDYKASFDDTVFYSGHQSLKMQFVGNGAAGK